MFGMFGLNIIPDRGDPRPLIRRLGSAVHLVMDDHALARDIKQISPESTVVYRAWNKDDAEYHHKPGFDVRRWVDTMRPLAVDDIVIQYLNEPQGYEDLTPLVDSCITAMDHAGSNMRLGLPTWGRGHPEESRVPELDRLFRRIHGTRHLYLIHAYGTHNTDKEPWHIERIRADLARSKAIGAPLNPRQVAVTEYGRDVGGGDGDGWQSVFNPEQYLQFLIGGAEIYRALGLLGVCIYAWGRGANGSWWSFNIERMEHGGADSTRVLLDGLVKYNEDHRHMPEFDYGEMYDAEVTGAFSPGGSAMRTDAGEGFPQVQGGALQVGDQIRISERSQRVGRYDWFHVEKLNGNGTVVASGKVADTSSFSWQRKSPVQPEPPVNGISSFWLTADELQQAITLERTRQQALEVAAAASKKIADLYQTALDRAGEPIPA